jgi:cytochrome c oxidase subunit II
MKSRFSLRILCLVLLAASPIGYVAHAQAAPRRIEIVAKRFDFTPGEITLKKGEPVVLVLKSLDVPHGIRFKELNIETKAGKGQTSELPFTPTKTGDFVGHCAVFCGAGHGTMTLKLHIVE